MLRIASYRIHQSLVQKPLPIEKYWPLPSDKRSVQTVNKFMSPELLAKIRGGIKKIHKIK